MTKMTRQELHSRQLVIGRRYAAVNPRGFVLWTRELLMRNVSGTWLLFTTKRGDFLFAEENREFETGTVFVDPATLTPEELATRAPLSQRPERLRKGIMPLLDFLHTSPEGRTMPLTRVTECRVHPGHYIFSEVGVGDMVLLGNEASRFFPAQMRTFVEDFPHTCNSICDH